MFKAGRRLICSIPPAFAVLFALMVSATAQPVNLNARYVVSMSGNIIAHLDIALADSGTDYVIDLSARVAGLGQFLASGNATAGAAGDSSDGTYTGETFDLRTHTSEGDFQIDVTYKSGNVDTFVVEPPLPIRGDRVPIERRHLTGVNDMLSAFVIKADALDVSICDRRLKIFNGTERFDLNMRFASAETATSARTGYQGPVILCQIDYEPISGHFTSSEVTNYLNQSDRILIWYAPVADSRTYIPYRVLLGTAMGDLSMVLTRLN